MRERELVQAMKDVERDVDVMAQRAHQVEGRIAHCERLMRALEIRRDRLVDLVERLEERIGTPG